MALGLVVLVAGIASASTIVVPFFNDGGSLAGTTPTGMRTFIRVKNLHTDTITCAITYTDFNGVDATPSPNTFLIGPKAAIGFRPVADDPVAEGPGQYVPNAVKTGTTFGVFGGGGCEISSTETILGMVSQADFFVAAGGGGSGVTIAVHVD